MDQLSATSLTIIQEPEIKAKLLGLGLEPSPPRPRLSSRRSRRPKWAELIKATNIKVDS